MIITTDTGDRDNTCYKAIEDVRHDYPSTGAARFMALHKMPRQTMWGGLVSWIQGLDNGLGRDHRFDRALDTRGTPRNLGSSKAPEEDKIDR